LEKYIHTGRHSCTMTPNADLTLLCKLKEGPDKPVLCLGTTSESPGFICSGSTDGKINAWRVRPGDPEDVNIKPILIGIKVHLMGVNAISVSKVSDELIIVSGGDDQAIGITRLDNSDVLRSKRLFPQSCGSAIRGICTNGQRIWSAGLNQRLRVWNITNDDTENPSLQFESPIDCADVNDLDVLNHKIVVSGAGFCVFSNCI